MRNSVRIIFCEVFSTVPFRELNLRRWGWSWELDNHSVMKAVWNSFLCFIFSVLMGFSLLNCDTWTPTPEYFKIVLSMSGEMLSIIFHRFSERSIMCQLPGRLVWKVKLFSETLDIQTVKHIYLTLPLISPCLFLNIYILVIFSRFGYFNYVLLRI